MPISHHTLYKPLGESRHAVAYEERRLNYLTLSVSLERAGGIRSERVVHDMATLM